jgi:hypothetical protein
MNTRAGITSVLEAITLAAKIWYVTWFNRLSRLKKKLLAHLDPGHEHDYHPLWKQPKIRQGIMILKCDCGRRIEQDADEFFQNARDGGRLYLFDFNNRRMKTSLGIAPVLEAIALAARYNERWGILAVKLEDDTLLESTRPFRMAATQEMIDDTIIKDPIWSDETFWRQTYDGSS